jgi:hypothetical protein
VLDFERGYRAGRAAALRDLREYVIQAFERVQGEVAYDNARQMADDLGLVDDHSDSVQSLWRAIGQTEALITELAGSEQGQTPETLARIIALQALAERYKDSFRLAIKAIEGARE